MFGSLIFYHPYLLYIRVSTDNDDVPMAFMPNTFNKYLGGHKVYSLSRPGTIRFFKLLEPRLLIEVGTSL